MRLSNEGYARLKAVFLNFRKQLVIIRVGLVGSYFIHALM